MTIEERLNHMSHVPHQLVDEFPQYKDKIHDLKINDNHFARFFEEYHDVNREIHRAEANGVNITDEHYEDLKKKRLSLKDTLLQKLED